MFTFLSSVVEAEGDRGGAGRSEEGEVPAVQPQVDTGEERLRGEPLQGVSSPPGD